MTPEEILEKIGLNGKTLKKFFLGKLLTDADATHATVFNEVADYLRDLNIPLDKADDILEPLIYETQSMVPESTMFKDFLRKKDKMPSDFIKFQNAFNNLVKAHLRMPLSMETVDSLNEGSKNLERLFDDLKSLRPSFAQGLSDVAEQFDDFQIGIFDKKFSELEKIKDYVETEVGIPKQFVDDVNVPEGFSRGNVRPPGMAFMGTEIDSVEKLIKGPFDDLINFTAAQELGNVIDPKLAAKAAAVLESSQDVGVQIVNAAKKFTKDAMRVTGKTVGVLDPGDVAIRTAVPKILASLGLGAISSTALTLYAIYEGALLLSDAIDGLEEAYAGRDDNENIQDFGEDFWKGFSEGGLTENYSLSYKLTEPIHNRLFGEVYDTMAETPKAPAAVGSGGGGRVKIL